MSQPLHQQQGGMSLRAFAEQVGLSVQCVRKLAKAGRVFGARLDSRSKKWTIYPPAKLVDSSGAGMKRREATTCGTSTAVDVGTSPHGLSADSLPSQPETRERSASPPSCKTGFNLAVSALPVAACMGAPARPEHGAPASCGRPLIYTEARSVCRALHEAAVKQYREGIHYLRMDAHELAQLYAALSNERKRVRQLVGKGLLPVGLLRVSDTVWHKMQAMCQQGRLL